MSSTSPEAPPPEEPPRENLIDLSKETLGTLFESSARITLATFGGGLVGLSLEQRPTLVVRRRAGPPVKNNGNHAVSKAWALSCMFFALILESSRLSSPTQRLLASQEMWASDSRQDRLMTRAVASVGDFAIGGTVAGLAGAGAHRRAFLLPPSLVPAGRQPHFLFAIGVGLSLGVLAGVLQAGIDCGTMYLEMIEQEEEGPEETVEETP